MSRFRQIQRGTRARRTIEFPLMHARCPLLPVVPELEQSRAKVAEAAGAEAPTDVPSTVKVDVRVLSADEEAEALRFAREYAVKRGGEPKAEDPLYDLGLMIGTLVRALVDWESPVDAVVPFFESADEVGELDRDRIAYLYEQQQSWQDECAPQASQFTEDQFFNWVVTLAASETPQNPFAYTRPGLRWTLTRTMAGLLLSSHLGKLPPGWLSSSSSKSESSKPSEAN